MKPRIQHALVIVGGMAALGIATALVFNALRSNLMFFFSPTQVAATEAPKDRAFRVGGLVEMGSTKRDAFGLTMSFIVTDTAKTVPVTYKGVPPEAAQAMEKAKHGQMPSLSKQMGSQAMGGTK